MDDKSILKMTETPLDCPCKGSGFVGDYPCGVHRYTKNEEERKDTLRESFRSLRDLVVFASNNLTTTSDFSDMIEARFQPETPEDWVNGAQTICRDFLSSLVQNKGEADNPQLSFNFTNNKD